MANSPYQIHSHARPGDLLERENSTHRNTSELLSTIASWVDRLDKELKARPLAREMNRQREEIEELGLSSDSEGYSTREEAEELRSRLSAFEEMFAKHIRESSENASEADNDGSGG